MDVLSEVLRGVKLTGAVFFDVAARAPWAIASADGESIRMRILPNASHIVPFHLMMEGSAWLDLGDGQAPVLAEAGDVVLMPRGHAHFLASDPKLRGKVDMSFYRRPQDQSLPFSITEVGGTGSLTRFACGYFSCDAAPFNPLLDSLPSLTIIKPRSEEGTYANRLMASAIREGAQHRPGGEAMLTTLSELMLIEALRNHLDTLPEESSGWLSGLRDPQVSRALALLHASPGRDWTLQSLSRETGLSRSALAERFTRLVGHPPMQYLARWRMQLATHALAQPHATIAGVAAEFGYESEASFNRAFKRVIGMPPGLWRRNHSDAA